MSLARRRIRWLSASLVAVLLLTQLATVAFACTAELAPPPVEPVQVMDDMPGCAQMGEAIEPRVSDTSLCFAHCDRGSQASSPSLVLDVYGAAVIQTGFRVSNASDSDLVAVVDRRRAHDVPTTGWPPPYLTFLVLRN